MRAFETAVREWVEQTKEDVSKICRAVGLQLATRIIMRSPVGNPELWAANAEAALRRSEHNEIVDKITSYLMSDPANVGPGGGLRRNVRSRYNKRLSKSQLAKMYPLRQGKGYVGGRFRGNWQVTMNVPASGTSETIDSNGSATVAAANASLASFRPGFTIYLVNNLPYSHRLEYESWSSQAPNGMVRITVAEFDDIVTGAVNQVISS